MPRPTLPRFATPTSSTLPLRSSRAARPFKTLLPAIPLYRRLLRLHRQKLNPEERIFGDTYLKAEFRRHMSIENPLHIVGFLQSWQTYGEMLDKKANEGVGVQEGERGDGTEWMKGSEEWAMEGLLEKMNDQQVGQVWELWNAIQKRNEGGTGDEASAEQVEGEDGVMHLDGKKS